MKIEKRKYKTLHIGDAVKVHSYEYVKELLENARLKNCDITTHRRVLYGKEYKVVSSNGVERITDITNGFPLAKFMYTLASDVGEYDFYEFEIINCE